LTKGRKTCCSAPVKLKGTASTKEKKIEKSGNRKRFTGGTVQGEMKVVNGGKGDWFPG